MNEKIEFLSRQHIDFRTLGGMKKLIQAVTWRVKIEESHEKAIIYVRKKRIPDVRRLAKELGIAGIKYEVKEIRWFECWFKRFQVVDLKPKYLHASGFRMTIKGVPVISWGFDPGSKDGDYSKVIKPIPKFISKGQGKTPTGETLYFVRDPDGLLEVDKTIILNGKALKVKKIVRKKGNQLTGIVTKFI